MNNTHVILLILVGFPLFTAILNGLIIKNTSRYISGTIATASVVISFILSCYLIFTDVIDGHNVYVKVFDWIILSHLSLSDIKISFDLMIDKLTAIMLMVVTGIGALIHLYSIQYMSHEKNVNRFFAYLNLFIFSMLILVTGANLLTTFLGWEGVGLCSYLLIGYWYQDKANVSAGTKAFIVNRIGDVGFLIAMFLAFGLFGTLNYSAMGDLAVLLQKNSDHTFEITLLGLFLLLAVTGKSAQIPLYVWLPDAMAGPTPVSALIHAATMVTAGVYMLTRTSAILVQSSIVMTTIAIVGAVTAVFAATIAAVQDDIKKILAYSTMSQLGYMILACGVGAFQYAIAHLVTHAFFKALLFLSAGSVIYALHHEQNIKKMGGLAKKLPKTFICFAVGTLAIIGFPALSGFFTKDAILFNAWVGPFGHPIFWFVGLLTAILTAFYMIRLIILVFYGKKNSAEIKDNNILMMLPMVILAILSVFGGVLAIPTEKEHNFIQAWLSTQLQAANTLMHARVQHHSELLEINLTIAAIIAMIVGSCLAAFLYLKNRDGDLKISRYLGKSFNLLRNKYFIDEIYAKILINPLKSLGHIFCKYTDLLIIESVVNESPKLLNIIMCMVSDLNINSLRTQLRAIFVWSIIIVLALCMYLTLG